MSESSIESKDIPLIAQNYPEQGFAPQDQHAWQAQMEAERMAQASRRRVFYPNGTNGNQGGDLNNSQFNGQDQYNRTNDRVNNQNINPERSEIIGLVTQIADCLNNRQYTAAWDGYEQAIEKAKQIDTKQVREDRVRAEQALATEADPRARKDIERQIGELKFLERGPGIIMAYYGESLMRAGKNAGDRNADDWMKAAHRADPTLRTDPDFLKKLPELYRKFGYVDPAVKSSDYAKASKEVEGQPQGQSLSKSLSGDPYVGQRPGQIPDLAQPIARSTEGQGIPGLDYDPGTQVVNEQPVLLRDNVVLAPNFDDPYNHLAKAKAYLVKSHGVITNEAQDEYEAALTASQRLEPNAIAQAIATTKDALAGTQVPAEKQALEAKLKHLDDLRMADCKISLSYAELLVKQGHGDAAQKHIDHAATLDDSAFSLVATAKRLTTEDKGSILHAKPFFEAAILASDTEALRQTKTDHKIFSDYPQLMSRAHYAIALNRASEPATHFKDAAALITEIKAKGFNGINDTKLACRLAEIEYASKVGVKLPTDIFDRELAGDSLVKFTAGLRKNWVNARNLAAEGKLASAADAYKNVDNYVKVLATDEKRGSKVLGERLKLVEGMLLNSKDKENIHYFPLTEPMRHQLESEAKAIKDLLVLKQQSTLSSLEFYNHGKVLRPEAKEVLKREQANLSNLGVDGLAAKSKTFLEQQAHIAETLNNQPLIKEQIASCKRNSDQSLAGTMSSLGGIFTASVADTALSKFPVTRAMPTVARLCTSIGLGGLTSGFVNNSILSMDKTNKNNNELNNFGGATISNIFGMGASMFIFKGFRPATPIAPVAAATEAQVAQLPANLAPVTDVVAKANPLAKVMELSKVAQAKAQPAMAMAANLWGKFATFDEGRFAATGLSAGVMAVINEGGRNLARVSGNEMNPFTKKPYTFNDAMLDTSIAFGSGVVSGMAANRVHSKLRTPGKVESGGTQALSTARWATAASVPYAASRVVHASLQEGPMKDREAIMDGPLKDYEGEEATRKSVKLSDDPLGLGNSGIDLTDAIKKK